MKLTRRQALLGGTAAVLAVPAVMQARWLATDHARPGFSPRPPAAPEGRRLWRNWSGLHHAAPSEIFSAQTEADLAARIATATGRVRPMGSGHAFIDLVPTDDMMVDVSRLSGLIEADPATRIARFGAGTRLRQAAMLADEAGLAFPNLPDIDVQTLAGSYATATHGTGRDLTALHGRITGFRLITPDGSTHDVTRASDPDLFDAGRVSMGALGVMTRFDVELVDRFALTRKMFLIPTEQAIETMHDQARSHHYHEFYVLPHTGYAAVITHDLHDGPVAGRAPSRDEDFIATFRTLRDVLGW
ncbi:FAD-binding protein [Paracoccus sp. p3-h83]